MLLQFPENPILLNEGIFLKSYLGSLHHSSYIPSLCYIGLSGFDSSNRTISNSFELPPLVIPPRPMTVSPLSDANGNVALAFWLPGPTYTLNNVREPFYDLWNLPCFSHTGHSGHMRGVCLCDYKPRANASAWKGVPWPLWRASMSSDRNFPRYSL